MVVGSGPVGKDAKVYPCGLRCRPGLHHLIGDTRIRPGLGAMLTFCSEFWYLIAPQVFLNLFFLDYIDKKKPFEISFSSCLKGLAMTWNNMFAGFHL